MAFFRELCSQQPDQPEHFLALARAMLAAGQPQVAVVQFQKALKLRPDAEITRELAETYSSMGKQALANKLLASLP